MPIIAVLALLVAVSPAAADICVSAADDVDRLDVGVEPVVWWTMAPGEFVDGFYVQVADGRELQVGTPYVRTCPNGHRAYRYPTGRALPPGLYLTRVTSWAYQRNPDGSITTLVLRGGEAARYFEVLPQGPAAPQSPEPPEPSIVCQTPTCP